MSVDALATDTAVPTAAGGPSTSRAITIMAIVGLFAYFNSLHGLYVLDDSHIIKSTNLGNPFNNSMTGRPVVAISLAVNYWLDQKQTRGYHVFNLMVHIAAAIVLFDLIRRTLVLPRVGEFWRGRAGWVAFIAAMVWLVHPLNTQSVTYIIQRCESMAGLFFLLAIWCYLRGATAIKNGAWWQIAGVVSNILGCGCKELMMALPPFLLLYDRAFLSGSWWGAIRQRWWVLLAHFVPPFVHILLLFVFKVFTETGTVGGKVVTFTPYTYALAQTEVILHYLRLSFWPSGLTLDYLDWPEKKSLREVWPTAVGLGILLLTTAYGVVRNKMWAVPAAGFFLYLAPTSSIVPIQDAAFEHRMYIPLVGVVVLFIIGIARLVLSVEGANASKVLRPAIGVAIALIVFLGFLTVLRNQDYASQEVITWKNLQERPNNPRVQSTYAAILSATGRLDEAEKELREATKKPRNIWQTHKDLIEVMYARGQVADAYNVVRQLYEQTSDADPSKNSLLPLMGQMEIQLNRPQDAVNTFTKAIKLDPNIDAAKFYLAVAWLQLAASTADAATAKSEAKKQIDALRQNQQDYRRDKAARLRAMALESTILDAQLNFALLEANVLELAREADDVATPDAYALLLARAKRFPEAVEMNKRAVIAAKRAKWDTEKLALLEERGRLYQANKPYLPKELDEFRASERQARR